MKRRHFLSIGAAAGLTSCATATSTITNANTAIATENAMPNKMTILFQGDSITDGGRRRERYYANDSGGMGGGYVNMLVGQIMKEYAGKDIKIYNRGISGNKVYQLRDRWNEDCMQLQPDVLSVMIGVNDFWHTLTNNYKGTIETYQNDLNDLLTSTKEALPHIKMIIGEPFAVKGGRAVSEFFDGTFDQYRVAAKEVATSMGAAFIPYHTIFAEATKVGGAKHWCPDGVHPSLAGCALMADAWMEAFNNLY